MIDFIRNDDAFFVVFDSAETMKEEGHGLAYADMETEFGGNAIVNVFRDNFSEAYRNYEQTEENFNAEHAQAGVVGHEAKHGVQFRQGMTPELYAQNKRSFERPAN